MSENLFGLTVAADPARKHGTYDPQISGADRGCGAVQDPYGSAPTENEVFGKVIEMAKARENIEYKSIPMCDLKIRILAPAFRFC